MLTPLSSPFALSLSLSLRPLQPWQSFPGIIIIAGSFGLIGLGMQAVSRFIDPRVSVACAAPSSTNTRVPSLPFP